LHKQMEKNKLDVFQKKKKKTEPSTTGWTKNKNSATRGSEKGGEGGAILTERGGKGPPHR